MAAYRKAYREANKERVNAAIQRWCEEHRERSNEIKRKWRDQNHVAELAAARERYRNTPRDVKNAYQNAYRAANPEVTRVDNAKRRKQLQVSGENFTAESVKLLYQLQDGCCAEPTCHAKLVKYHIDHILPMCLGGDNSFFNIQLLCPSCNVRKGRLHPDEWNRINGRQTATGSLCDDDARQE